jgi:hypothetical protein
MARTKTVEGGGSDPVWDNTMNQTLRIALENTGTVVALPWSPLDSRPDRADWQL